MVTSRFKLPATLFGLALFITAVTGCSRAGIEPNGLVVLLTDYGETGSYVGSLKGSIYSVFPEARIDTITNEVESFNVLEGAYILAEAARDFPPGTVFCAVVDPGVGTSRREIAALTKDGKYFVGPDNGLLSLALQESGVREVRETTNRRLFRKESSTSSTFHGKDIFGPVAAHIASGVPFERVGPRIQKYERVQFREPEARDGYVEGSIVHKDKYGNLATNIPLELLERAGIRKGEHIEIAVSEPAQRKGATPQTVRAKLVSTYADVPKGEFLCLLNSRGKLELAVNLGSAAARLGVRPGAIVRISRTAGEHDDNTTAAPDLPQAE